MVGVTGQALFLSFLVKGHVLVFQKGLDELDLGVMAFLSVVDGKLGLKGFIGVLVWYVLRLEGEIQVFVFYITYPEAGAI